MKHNFSILLVCVSFFISGKSHAQLTFSAGTGINLHSASIGYRVNNFVPFFSLQVLGVNTQYNRTGQRYDPNPGQIVSYEDKYNTKVTAYIPVIGARYFFGQNDKLKPYATICVTKVILSGSTEDSDNPDAAKEFKESLKQTSIFGTQFGFGTEYFFDDNFSIGGEFGLRWAKGTNEMEETVAVYDPNSGNYVDTKQITKSAFSASPTYVRLSFNFYFTK